MIQSLGLLPRRPEDLYHADGIFRGEADGRWKLAYVENRPIDTDSP